VKSKYEYDADGNRVSLGLLSYATDEGNERINPVVTVINPPQERKKYGCKWISCWTEDGEEGGLKMLAKMDLTSTDYKLLLYLLDCIGYNNEVKLAPSILVKELQVKSRTTIYAAKKRLIAANILIYDKKTDMLRVNPRIGVRQNIEEGKILKHEAPEIKTSFH
jgi:hypothetical protein